MLELFPEDSRSCTAAARARARRVHERGRRGGSGRRSAAPRRQTSPGLGGPLAPVPQARPRRRLWIGPPWEAPTPMRIAVVIDPGRAFGTGGHPTTQLCLQLLEAESAAACSTSAAARASSRSPRPSSASRPGDRPRLRPARRRGDRPQRRRQRRRRRRAARRPARRTNRSRGRRGAREHRRRGGARARRGCARRARSPPATSSRTSRSSTATASSAPRSGRRLGGRPAARCASSAFRLDGELLRLTPLLGCKVSHTDAQAVRERLLRDGHREVEGGGDVAVVNTCCVTNEGLAKSRQAASRAARSHARVYVTGCGARLSGDGRSPACPRT